MRNIRKVANLKLLVEAGNFSCKTVIFRARGTIRAKPVRGIAIKSSALAGLVTLA
jgi:hypothetical protein